MTEQSSKISVVIPAYNAHSTIERAIVSVLTQTVPVREIIVVDDGSEFDLRPLLAKYGGRVTCVRQENAGAAAARNTGLRLAKGRWIAFLDADDTWEPNKLAVQSEILKAYPSVGLVASAYYTQQPRWESRAVQQIDRRFLDRVLEPVGADLFALTAAIWTGTVMVRRNALGEKRFVSGLEPAEDRDLWLRVVADHRSYIISEPLATAVLEPDSLSRRDADSGYEPMIRVLDRHRALVSAGAMRQLQAGVYRAWAAAHLGARRPRNALRPALQRWKRQPLHPQAWWIVAKCLIQSFAGRPAEISHNGRDRTALQRQFEIERELATRLRTADAAQRRSLYGEVYDELFARVADHPQNTRKNDPSAQHRAAETQLRLLKHFLQRESRYLEVGAGDCHLAMQVAQFVRRAHGVDVSNVIAASHQQPANFSLLITDGVKIDLPASSIDVAYSNQLMEHLHPDDAAHQLAQIRRTLAKGGCYVCVTPHRFSGPHDVSRFFADEACGFHLKEYTYRELSDVMRAAGFDATHVWTGVKGIFFRVPTTLVIAVERMLLMFGPKLRRTITKSILFRPIFTNVLLVGRVAQRSSRAVSVGDLCDITERPAHS